MNPSTDASLPAVVLLSLLPLVGWMAAACWTDCRGGRIPNTLTFTLLAAGLVRAGFLDMLGAAGVGILVGMLLILPLFLLGAMGGGDLKLMAALGCWVMPSGIIDVFATAAVMAAGYVLIQALHRRHLGTLLQNCGLLALSLMQWRRLGREQVIANGMCYKPSQQRLPYAVPATLGCILVAAGLGVGSLL